MIPVSSYKLPACPAGRQATSQNARLKSLGFLFMLASCVLRPAAFAYAKEITIIYTGQTQAMIYPCNCPKEPDGGIARRATLIKQLKNDNPESLLLDSGGFFEGGLMYEYAQNAPLDMQRSGINLKAMELMGYDALGIGENEFNFGRQFLEEHISKTNLPFLSCNISAASQGKEPNSFKSYLIKEISGIRVGITGVTGLSAMPKSGGLNFTEPKVAVRKAVEELKKNKADIIILLSNLGEDGELRLIKEIEGIDIVIVGYKTTKTEPVTKIDSTLILRPTWQGRRLDRINLAIENKKIIDYKVEQARLHDGIADDQEMLSILPSCFSDANCKKEGMIGTCKDPGSPSGGCQFSKPVEIKLLIIAPKVCITCNTDNTINYLKSRFPGLIVSYVYHPDLKADKLINDFDIKSLPIFLLDKDIEKEKEFDNFKENLIIKGNFYMLKPQVGGIAHYLNRENKKGKIDLFMSLFDESAGELLDNIKEFNPEIHFLTAEQKENEFNAANGNLEIEEYLRAVCVQKYYPDSFFGYIRCRSRHKNSSWWEDCLDSSLDTNKVKTCAKDEGKSLLRENIRLNKELGIMFGPTYLMDNQEIFSSRHPPKKEEFKKIFLRE
ncbi:MAG: hypothetical protein NTW64_06050 [Candidatus Omnitrophica bacterium]|nr:hypothetical protein [Candidatus Omnitrophota bacterium]